MNVILYSINQATMLVTHPISVTLHNMAANKDLMGLSIGKKLFCTSISKWSLCVFGSSTQHHQGYANAGIVFYSPDIEDQHA